MEVRLKIVRILDARNYVDRNGNTKYVYSAVGETLSQYPNKVKFEVFGEEKWKGMNFVVGNVYDISVDISSREWNGRYYTSVIAYSATQSTDGKPSNANNVAREHQQRPQVAQQQMVQQSVNATVGNVDTFDDDATDDKLPF